MKKRIQHLLFSDNERLPLLSLIPNSTEFTGEASQSLLKLGPALLTRLESAKNMQRDLNNSINDDTAEASGLNQVLQEIDCEISMLQSVLDWIALQEER